MRRGGVVSFWLGLALAAAGASAACAQTLGGRGEAYEPSLLKAVISLSICIFVAVAGASLLYIKKNGGLPLQFRAPRVKPRRLDLVETLRVGPSLNVCVLEYEGRTLLISAGPAGCSLILDVSDSKEASK